ATLRQIERHTGAAIAPHVIPGLEPRSRSSRDASPARGRPGGGNARAAQARDPHGRTGYAPRQSGWQGKTGARVR
ncbi:MAG: DEAD/DEAH box helicase, partial [Casimicrobiaceae bacterium]